MTAVPCHHKCTLCNTVVNTDRCIVMIAWCLQVLSSRLPTFVREEFCAMGKDKWTIRGASLRPRIQDNFKQCFWTGECSTVATYHQQPRTDYCGFTCTCINETSHFTLLSQWFLVPAKSTPFNHCPTWGKFGYFVKRGRCDRQHAKCSSGSPLTSGTGINYISIKLTQ
jgi:hypothetical protein